MLAGMERKDIGVRCPECGANLIVDLRTGQVIRHQAKKRPGQDLLAEAMQKIQKKKEQDLFGQAVEKAARPVDPDQAFAEACRKAEEKGETFVNPMDL